MTKSKLLAVKEHIKFMIEYPDKSQPRRTHDGYPLELAYDEFAYKRIIDSYRNGLKRLLKKIKELK